MTFFDLTRRAVGFYYKHADESRPVSGPTRGTETS